MNTKLNTNGVFQSSHKISVKAYSALYPFVYIVRWVKLEVEDMGSRIHLLFFKNLYPSIKH
jgi:hypothetical protein